MSDVIRGRQWRSVALSLVLGLIVIGMGALPALAAATPFHVTYPDEVTTQRPCPPGFPAGAFCFTGVGHGMPLVGTTKIDSTESYAGFVDFTTHDPVTGCPVDRNAVSITTSSGTLFLTTRGASCPPFDNGTWEAVGGTGIFEGATGSGTVTTVSTGVNPDKTIASKSTYDGTLNLHGD
jgi:hypothetical protein